MEFVIKFVVDDLVVDPHSNLPDEIIKEELIDYIKGMLSWDRYTTGENELYIDTSDDGDQKYNIYRISLSPNQE